MSQYIKNLCAFFVARAKALAVAAGVGGATVLLSERPASAAVTNLFTEAGVTTAFEGWTASVGTVLAVAVGVAFALMAVFGAMALIRRIATRGVR